MADVLSQSEIDALLAAVSEPSGRAETGSADASYYDFLRPELASSIQMRALTDLHEAAARNIAAALGGALRTDVECRLQGFDQVTWGEFAMGVPNPTCLAVVVARRQGVRFALEIGPAVMHPMIERLLGAPLDASLATAPGDPVGAVAEVPVRPLTAIERRVAGTIVEVILEALAAVWSRGGQVELAPAQIESNPRIVPVAPPGEMAAMATFEVSVGQPGRPASAGAGPAALMHLCIPSPALAPLFGALSRLAGQGCCGRPAGAVGPLEAERAAAREATRAALMRVPVKVEAYVGWTRMTLREVAGLSVGDTIRTGRSTADGVILTVAGVPKFASTAGEFRGRKAVRVSGRLETPPVGFAAEGGGGAAR